MITLDAERAGGALGLGALRAPVTGVSIDSRSLKAGDLFVAIRGECHDGHHYVDTVLAEGASGAIVDKAVWSGADGRPIYGVDDTVAALGALAREVRRLSKATVFAVTGSAGKTSTKDALKAMIGRARSVVATSGNQNNEVGVPLTLLRLQPDTQAMVVEMGMRGLGQIAELASVAEPDVGIITNIYPVHLELLGSLENVAKAKAEIVAGIAPGGAVVIPAGCEYLEPLVAACSCRLLRFGVGSAGGKTQEGGAALPAADVRGWLEPHEEGGYAWRLRWPEGESRVSVGYMPGHALENAVAAATACYAAGLPMEECMSGIADVELSEGRGQTIQVGGLCVIDDTYNANPAAVRVALDDLVRLASERKGRAVAVLGDMLEMGEQSAQYHKGIGEYAAAVGVSVLWGVGPMSVATVEGFECWQRDHAEAGREWNAGWLESYADTDAVMAGSRPGDVVLVKGSRGVRLENVVIRMVGEANAGKWGGGSVQTSMTT